MRAFAQMTPAQRASMIEDTRCVLREASAKAGHVLAEDPPLSTETQAWLERLQSALVDSACSSESYRSMDNAAFAAVRPDEADELRGRLDEFVQLRDVFPLYVSSAEEALPAVLRGLLRKVEASSA
jgi:hypothetical protein